MKLLSPNGKLNDFRKIKRIFGWYLRDYRNGKLPIERWAGRRPPSVTWRKYQSKIKRQRNYQQWMDKSK